VLDEVSLVLSVDTCLVLPLYPHLPRMMYSAKPKIIKGIDSDMNVPRQPIAPAIPAAMSGVRKKLAVPPIW